MTKPKVLMGKSWVKATLTDFIENPPKEGGNGLPHGIPRSSITYYLKSNTFFCAQPMADLVWHIELVLQGLDGRGGIDPQVTLSAYYEVVNNDTYKELVKELAFTKMIKACPGPQPQDSLDSSTGSSTTFTTTASTSPLNTTREAKGDDSDDITEVLPVMRKSFRASSISSGDNSHAGSGDHAGLDNSGTTLDTSISCSTCDKEPADHNDTSTSTEECQVECSCDANPSAAAPAHVAITMEGEEDVPSRDGEPLPAPTHQKDSLRWYHKVWNGIKWVGSRIGSLCRRFGSWIRGLWCREATTTTTTTSTEDNDLPYVVIVEDECINGGSAAVPPPVPPPPPSPPCGDRILVGLLLNKAKKMSQFSTKAIVKSVRPW